MPADPAEQVVWSAPIGPSGALITATCDEKTSTVDWAAGCAILTAEEREADQPPALPMNMAEMRLRIIDLETRVRQLEGGRL